MTASSDRETLPDTGPAPPFSRTFAFGIPLLFALASAFGINPYHYGLIDNFITIPLVKAFVDPQLYPGDFMLAQRPFYYTYAWDALGWLHVHLGISIPTLFFLTYIVVLYATFVAFSLLGIRLFRSRGAASLALVFLVFSKLSLAGVDTIESLLNTRAIATPLLLFAFLLFLNRRTVAAFGLLGLAYLVHPLTAHYGLVMLVAASIVEIRNRGWRSILAGLCVFLLIASPILAWKFTSSPPSLSLFTADPQWLQAMRLRSSHHMFPLTWGWWALVHTMLTIALLAIAWRGRPHADPDAHRIMASFMWTILALCAGGVIFAELVPWGATFLFQPLRSFQLLDLFAMLYVANFVYSRLESAKRLADLLPPVLAGLAMFFDVPHPHRPVILFLIISAIIASQRFAWRRGLSRAGMVAGMTGLVVVTGGLRYVRGLAGTEPAPFSISIPQDPRWLEVEDWAREHSAKQDAFIVPPLDDGAFRAESERTIYADWEDGGLMNSNPAYGIEWMRRMRMLGFASYATFRQDYRDLKPKAVLGVARELEAGRARVFVVERSADGSKGFPIRYQNAEFMIAEVTGLADRTGVHARG
jgi:hypothetical protein